MNENSIFLNCIQLIEQNFKHIVPSYYSSQRLFSVDRFYIKGFLESWIRFYINMEYITVSVWGRYYPFAQMVQWLVQCYGCISVLLWCLLHHAAVLPHLFNYLLLLPFPSLTPIQHWEFLKVLSRHRELESRPYLSWDTDKLRCIEFSGCLCTPSVTAELASAA